jgi:tellurite resistance protein
MTSTVPTRPAAAGTLCYLPVALFGSVMSLTGLAVGWRLAHARFGTPAWIAHAIADVALVSFLMLVVAYLVKAATSFGSALAEFRHPVTGNLFGTPLISLLLIPVLLADRHLTLARVVWAIGVAGMTLFAWLIVMRWISIRQKARYATPAWIIPVVGMINVPIAVPSLGWAHELHGLMSFATSIGLFFAVPLFTMILSRLMFEAPLPDREQPSLLILAAPFAVGFSGYTATAGEIDSFATSLYMLMPFILAVLIARIRHLTSACPFRMSWWSVSFPLAACADAAMSYSSSTQEPVAGMLAVVLLALASVVIALLFIRTIWGIVRGELRTLSN